ncbi:DNA-directed RNA polymerase family protein [Salix suchowensis]|nr:DNA-directed RNA polymerase family protein [Salix suchowensis]
MEKVGPSSKGEVDDMEMDEDLMDITDLNELGRETMQSFCKKAASLFFFDEYGLISHQINSCNAFINSGLQRVFDSFGEVAVEPGYDTSKQKDGEWRCASVRLRKVALNRPSFWGGTSSDAEHNMFFRHARLQNMTYSARMKSVMLVEVNAIKVSVLFEIFWDAWGNCDFDQGGYIFIKGVEKVLWISNSQDWTVSYNFEVKRNKLIVRLKRKASCVLLVDRDPDMDIIFSLGVRSDNEVIDLIDYASNNASIVNIFFCISVPRLNSRRHKARFLGYMVKCLLEAYTGHRKCDNRDSFRNQRFKLASELLERELKVHVSYVLRCMTKALQRDLYGNHVSIVTNGLTRALGHGVLLFKWMERVYGVVGNLGRANPLQTMIDLRKTRQQVLVCFLSTPDGENYGLVKRKKENKIFGCHWIDELFDSGMEKLGDDTYTKLDGKHKVFLNGEWVGVCEDSCLWKSERDEQQREARIFSDAGRILPFKGGNYIVASLRDKGIIEFIGTEEEEDCCTAWGIRFLLEDIAGKQSMKYTHCELDMSFYTLVMKRASLGRSMFRSEHIRSYKAEVDNEELTDKRQNLDDDGFSFISANMQSGDIVIRKCAESGTDHKVKLKHTERGMVQKVVLSSSDEGKNFAVVSWRQTSFSSMHGQKWCSGLFGVSGELPFHKSRCVPDIVINPHAFSSPRVINLCDHNIATHNTKTPSTPQPLMGGSFIRWKGSMFILWNILRNPISYTKNSKR